MRLTGVHLLLTYTCTRECDHCFVWGSPEQRGSMTLRQIDEILDQAERLGSVDWIYFEGGEPFLYYAVLLRGVTEAARRGFRVGIVSNAYWATSVDDAREWLGPFGGLVEDLSVSRDVYHEGNSLQGNPDYARAAAASLGIPAGALTTASPDESNGEGSTLMYRGRAVDRLLPTSDLRPPSNFRECPYENLRDPGRVHVDPFGEVHVCQGISLGNLFQTPLAEICDTYDPDSHAVVGPLLRGGPAELAHRYGVEGAGAYADACHLCYETRNALRARFPRVLCPAAMYGTTEPED